MANMKVVNTEWTGCCVIACDCGSEEPVEGTVHSVASGVLEDEIKRLRQEVSILKRRSEANYEGWDNAREELDALLLDNIALKKQIAKDEWVHEDRIRAIQKSQLKEDRIEQLDKYIEIWRDLWMAERGHNRELRDRFERQFDGENFSPNEEG